MKSIGGYFELELRKGDFPHSDGILVNSGSHALQFIVRQLGIRQIFIPAYTCSVVPAALRAVDCTPIEYDIAPDLRPARDFPSDAFILYNNYFGVCDIQVQELAASYANLIVDNAQAFYANPCGAASFYSPRKFFGVPDGGIACFRAGTPIVPTDAIPSSVSFSRCTHLLKRIDLGAQAAYPDFRNNDDYIVKSSMAMMSPLTRAILENVDYDYVAERRRNNFNMLHSRLAVTNLLQLELGNVSIPLVYPYLVKDGCKLKQSLIENDIFCPTYWPNLETDSQTVANLASSLVCVPIDQRYGVSEMNYVLNRILGY